MAKMPQALSSGDLRRAANYSNCPLKKRPIKYDLEDESDSDNSRNDSFQTTTVEISEPENLSTKLEDMRMKSPMMTTTHSPGNLSPVDIPENRFNHHLYGPPLPLQYAQARHTYPQLPDLPLLRFSPSGSSGGPLEPISLNPAAAWSRISPFSAFNCPITSTSYPSYQHPRNQNQFDDQQIHPLNFVKSQRSEMTFSGKEFHVESQFPSASPPPLSYPLIKQEISSTRRWSDSAVSPIIKRESIISHTHSHSCCSSGGSSPSSSSSSSSSEKTTSDGIPSGNSTSPGVRYQCPECNKSYSTYSGLNKHVQFHCSSQNTKSFICKYCEKVYVSLGALKMHIRTHTLPCKCMKCGKAFSRPWLLQGHIRTHTGEKPFSCEHCHRAFADRSNLRAHLQTHSEVKKYSCKFCDKTFSRMSLLVKHEIGGCLTVSN